MISPDIRQEIHRLIDKATDNQLDVILDVLRPSSSRYTKEELDIFNQRVKSFEATDHKSYSVEESHALVRSKYQNNGL